MAHETATGGAAQWRSLEEWTESATFQKMLADEFPEHAAEWTDPVSRRHFLQLMAASLALAGVSGCSTRPAPPEKIMPYARQQPEQMTPGLPLYFATAMPLSGVGTGLLVKSREGRPIKIEGNPQHPASLGSTDIYNQASILGLYDPDRSQAVTYLGATRPRDEALNALRQALEKQRGRRGAGLRLLTETVSSPTLAAQIDDLMRAYPEAKWVQWEPAGRDEVREGARLAFGNDVNTYYDFARADVVLALDADFLGCGVGSLRYTRDFIQRRKVRTSKDGQPPKMNRLYVAECMPTNTGMIADHRLALRNSEIASFARALAAQLGVAGVPAAGSLSEEARGWLAPLAADLKRHGGACIVLAGDRQPAHVHALVHAINTTLGNAAKTVLYSDPVDARPTNQLADLRQLTDDMANGKVDTLLVFGGNPVFTAPVDLDFEEHLEKVPLRFHLGLYQDETAVLCHWHIPESHYLESWSDIRAYDGTVTILQPLIAPLYRGRSAHEVLASCREESERLGRDIVRAHWQEVWKREKRSTDFEVFWEKTLQDGLIADSALPRKSVTLRGDWARQAPAASGDAEKLEIAFQFDQGLYDGRFANNGWLQELPRPVTKLTWDNALLLSPRTAEKLRLKDVIGASGGEHGHVDADVVELTYRGRRLEMPVLIVPGHADNAGTVFLGFGRERAGRVGDRTGVNVYALRTSQASWFDTGLEIKKTGKRYPLACTQRHHDMGDRQPVRHANLDEYRRTPTFAQVLPVDDRQQRAIKDLVPGPGEGTQDRKQVDRRLVPLTLYPEVPYEGRRWAMAIDLTACVGCNACVVACQAENNIPVVGKKEVSRGREMHWLRIDRYFEGDPRVPAEFKGHFQPVPCMHCEKAPCEVVCPVAATVHSHDGLNDMVYNRCVGTRYCSNNCPYKVRRFNFLHYADYTTASLKLLHNPEVTVRSRGVMEKCTYCVQRIRAAEIDAEREHRPIADGEIQTACQAACPANAIIFGDLNDKKSRVSEWKAEPLNYALLAELNTQPRTTYLASLRNPNPEMPGKD